MILNILKRLEIVSSAKILRGNRKTIVIFEPIFGVSFALFNFYISLYMKQLGITNAQLGYISSIGYISAAVFSFLGGPIVDKLGRKKSLLIFDLVSWIGALTIWIFAKNFFMFVLAAVVNNFIRVSMVSCTCLIAEGSTSHERVVTYNLKNISNLCIGILVPISGAVVNHFGILTGERILIVFAIVGIIILAFTRNAKLYETEEGLQIINEQKSPNGTYEDNVCVEAFKRIITNKVVMFVIIASVFQQLFIVISPFSAVFLAPYLKEVVGFKNSQISYLGSIYSLVMLLVFIFVVPTITKRNNFLNSVTGLIIQIISIGCILLIPKGNFMISVVAMIIYGIGFAISRAFLDAVLVNVTEFKEKAGIYAIYNGITSILCVLAAVSSGLLYNKTPALLSIISLICLSISSVFLILVLCLNNKNHSKKGILND